MATHNHRRARAFRTGALLSAMFSITACAGKHADEAADGNLRILSISSPDYHGAPGDPLEDACQAWTLSPQQVDRFFRSSQTYSEVPYGEFYQVACGVSGRLSAEGRVWTFQINGGGTAIWRNGETMRHFGCASETCEPLLLLPPDGMAPD
ncbi:hypothetical protein [Luteimonas terrae]|uniref:Lipoprotein n=1 Tax=Luteimonas terrae TaxID=1530191 RepID=A0ABU1Y0G7_9GAMM|nr:hypothetical protein [Luteimonas terrae]MDR7194522.1 hypothetical protein [Luteimonas terrae]